MKIKCVRWVISAICVTLFGCGAPRRATLTELISQLPKPQTARNWAELGWWRYLAEDSAGAKDAFDKGASDDLSQLGQLQLAVDQLNRARIKSVSHNLTRRSDDLGAIARGLVRAAQYPLHSVPHVRLRGCKKTLIKAQFPLTQLTFLSRTPPLSVSENRRVPPQTSTGAKDSIQGQKTRPITVLACPPQQAIGTIEVGLFGPSIIWETDQASMVQASTEKPRFFVLEHDASAGFQLAWMGEKPPEFRQLARPQSQGPFTQLDTQLPHTHAKPNWVNRYLTASKSLSAGDLSTAWTSLIGAPKTAAFVLLRAALWWRMDGVSQRERFDIREESLRHGLKLSPIRSGLALSQLLRRRSQPQKAYEVIEKARLKAPRHGAVLGERLRCLVALGEKEKARSMLGYAASLQDNPCELFDLEFKLGAQIPGHRDQLLKRIHQCGTPLGAARMLLSWHQPHKALAVVSSLDQAKPENRIVKVKALLALGRLEDAEKSIGKPETFELLRLAVDFEQSRAQSHELPHKVQQLVHSHLTDESALELLAARPKWSPFVTLYQDTEKAIADFESTNKSQSTTRVLDHSILVVDHQNRALRRVHEVIAIRSRDAAEEFGELSLPADAQPVLIFTRKADKSRRYALWSSDKESISMPGLVPGDYVVAIYLEKAENLALNPGAFLSDRAFFKDLNLPIFRGYFDMIAPSGIPIKYERLHGARAPDTQRMGSMHHASFRFGGTKAALSEPRSPTPSAWLPSIRVGHQVKFEMGLKSIQERILGLRQTNPRFRSWLSTLLDGIPDHQTVAQILSAVRRVYVHNDGLLSYSVNRGQSDGHGHRALAMSAALEMLGIDHQLVLAGQSAQNVGSVFEQADDYPTAIIQLSDGTVIVPGFERGALNYLPFSLRGSDGIVVWPPTSGVRRITLPSQTISEDRRRVRLDAVWTNEGVLEGEVDDILEGHEAIIIGNYLARLDSENHHQLVEKLLVRAISSGQVTHLEPVNLEQNASQLRLKYRFKAVVGRQMEMGVFSVSPAVTYAPLPKRRSPLVLSVPVKQDVVMRIQGHGPWTVNTSSAREAWNGHNFEMHTEIDERGITVRSRLEIQAGVIGAQSYPKFVEWARRVDDGERLSISRD